MYCIFRVETVFPARSALGVRSQSAFALLVVVGPPARRVDIQQPLLQRQLQVGPRRLGNGKFSSSRLAKCAVYSAVFVNIIYARNGHNPVSSAGRHHIADGGARVALWFSVPGAAVIAHQHACVSDRVVGVGIYAHRIPRQRALLGSESNSARRKSWGQASDVVVQ